MCEHAQIKAGVGMEKALSSIEFVQEYCGSRIYMKRDDKIPFSFGGNKVRIAGELFDDIRKGGYTAVISYGSASSNMNRAIADTAKLNNIKCYCIIKKEPGAAETENERLVKLSGAEIIYCGGNDVKACVEAVIDKAVSEGYKPYYIYGDSTGKGNEAALMRASYKEYGEILDYEGESDIEFDAIVLTVGTDMTISGLAAAMSDSLAEGKKAHSCKLVGISAARSRESVMSHIGEDMKSFFGGDGQRIRVLPEIKDEYLCGGYGKYNEHIEAVIREVESKGILLDPCYTGKSWWGMLSEIEKGGICGNILFIHTGGYPVYLDWKNTL